MSTEPVVVAEPLEHRVNVADCETTAVTVFFSRAEVTRAVVFEPPADATPDLYVIIAQGMTACADSDSIRVKDRTTATPATRLIREVSYEVQHRTNDTSAEQPRAKAAREAKEASVEEQQTIRAKLKRIRERDDLLQGYMKSMLVMPSTKSNSSQPLPAGPAAGGDINAVKGLLDFYQTHSNTVDSEIADLEKQLKEARDKQTAANAELSACQASTANVTVSRDVTIVLDGPTARELAAENDGRVVLAMTYIVTGASWAPIYDIRVDDIHADPVPTTMEVTYSAVIRQATAEDWRNVAVQLSTASTAAGKGAPPLPPTRIARWQRRVIPAPDFARGTMTNIAMPVQASMNLRARMPMRRRGRATSLSAHENSMSDSDSEDSCSADELDMEGPPSPTSASSGASKSKKAHISAKTFTIERRLTIKADNKEHKCTIAVVTCPATFRLFATPALEELAYIQVRATNGGDVTFVESRRASVFLAGSFITKTPLKNTSPGQSFIVFLGVESAVKVEHRVVKDVETTGAPKKLLRAKTDSTRVLEYRTLINNNLPRAIEMTVVHLLPRSQVDKIKVKLLEPPRNSVPISGESGSKGGSKSASSGENALAANSVMQNKLTNNVVFNRTLEARSKQELTFSYEIQWPIDEPKVEIV